MRAAQPSVAGVLLADEDLAQRQARVLVVGAVRDPAAQALVGQALAFSAERDGVVRWDGRTGDAPGLAHLPTRVTAGVYVGAGTGWGRSICPLSRAR